MSHRRGLDIYLIGLALAFGFILVLLLVLFASGGELIKASELQTAMDEDRDYSFEQVCKEGLMFQQENDPEGLYFRLTLNEWERYGVLLAQYARISKFEWVAAASGRRVILAKKVA